MKRKMNGLYKAAFVLLMICILMFAVAIIFAYALERPTISVLFSGTGVLLATLGIIFATVSKPKKFKKTVIYEKNENNIDK